MGYNQKQQPQQLLFQPSGALDPYGNQGGEFQQSRDYGKPQRQEQPMLDPQRMAWAQALSNIGSIWAGQPMSNSVGGAYAQAKAQNDKFRQNKAALARQGQQDELMKRYRESQIFKNFNGESSGGKIGTVNPRDFTPESIAKYQQTENINDLVRYTPKVVDIGGIKHRENQETGKWEPIVDLNSPDYIEQINQAVALKQEEQTALDFAKEESKWRAGEVNYLNSINSAEQKSDVITETADEIKKMLNAWTTGGGSLLKSLPGTDARQLAGLLDTIKANSAFTTLIQLKAAGGTLGAISEAELNLLERAWGALDQGGDPKELLRVLKQLVEQNAGSVSRLKYGYNEDSKRYGSNLIDSPAVSLPKAQPTRVYNPETGKIE